jgi:murein DD-endopeptidase MepM/ murein hydrolase activator NlpD
LRGRVVLAAVAAGAFVAAGSTLNQAHSSSDKPPDGEAALAGGAAQAAFGIGGGTTPSDLLRPQVLAFAKNEPNQLQNLAKGERFGAERAAREAAARRPLYVLPAVGTFTSGFGIRWGVMHSGIDIANKIGTPIKAVADGVVVESGPASGFGLWVRIRHADGTITVYGHVDRTLVREGQQVQAGQQIATMGNRGISTGPHLHFEVWDPDGTKINPLGWLRARGINV